MEVFWLLSAIVGVVSSLRKANRYSNHSTRRKRTAWEWASRLAGRSLNRSGASCGRNQTPVVVQFSRSAYRRVSNRTRTVSVPPAVAGGCAAVRLLTYQHALKGYAP